MVQKLAALIKLTFIAEKVQTDSTFAPVDILDYIYAVLHSPTYREKYKEFLKIDIVSIEEESVIEAFWSSSSGAYFSKLDDYSSVSETASVALLQRKIEISVMEAIVKNAANISKGIKHSILELANYYRQNVRYR